MRKTTVLFIMSRLPFPTTSGRKTSLYHYCRIIHDELHCRLVVAAFLESGDDPEIKPDFIDLLEILPKPRTSEKLKNILWCSLIRKKYPLQVSLFLSKQAYTCIDELVTEEKPDIIIGDMVRCTEYIRNLSAFTVADLDDRLSLRYKRQLEVGLDRINPYGASLFTVPKFLQKIMLLKPIKTFIVKNEISLLNKYELEVGRDCSATVFVAKKEAEEFNQDLGEEKAIDAPIGVATEYFYYRECGNNVDNYIGFLGVLKANHNENAVKHFIEDIFPQILQTIPNAKFIVIGRGASPELLNLSSEHVIFTGCADDVRKYLEKCKVFVCPVLFGSGIKTKNLEAMAMGLPVITTSIGAENIGALHNRDWIISDENRFSDDVITLINSESTRKEM